MPQFVRNVDVTQTVIAGIPDDQVGVSTETSASLASGAEETLATISGAAGVAKQIRQLAAHIGDPSGTSGTSYVWLEHTDGTTVTRYVLEVVTGGAGVMNVHTAGLVAGTTGIVTSADALLSASFDADEATSISYADFIKSLWILNGETVTIKHHNGSNQSNTTTRALKAIVGHFNV